MQENSKKGN